MSKKKLLHTITRNIYATLIENSFIQDIMGYYEMLMEVEWLFLNRRFQIKRI